MEEQLNRIDRAVEKLLVPISLREVYKQVIDQGRELVEGFGGTLFLYRRRRKRFERVFTTLPKKMWFVRGNEKIVAEVYKTLEPRLVMKEEMEKHFEVVKDGVEAMILVPLAFRRKRMGVLILKSRLKRPYKETDRDLAMLFGTIASLSIRNAELYQQKKEALELSDLFVSIASHEFKTPLTAIKAYAQLVEKKVKSQEKVEVKMTSAIVRNADRLTEIINSVYLMSQIKGGTFGVIKRKLDFKRLAKRSVEDLRVATGRVITLKCDEEKLLIRGDENKLASVVLNLLRNAIKYSVEKTLIEVEVSKEDHNMILSVKDQGRGISKRDLKKVFRKYVRGNRSTQGLGIGLFLCKEIVKAHKGKIVIESELNKGTKVVVSLPI